MIKRSLRELFDTAKARIVPTDPTIGVDDPACPKSDGFPTTGNIMVRFETKRPAHYSLSVSDNGPGLPIRFNPACSKGLGMKIVLSLVKQIGGELHILRGDNGRGARVAVAFCFPGRG